MEFHDKFVDFHKYCPLCENEKTPEGDDPCNECLCYPANTDSHKPLNFKSKNIEEKKNEQRKNDNRDS